MTKAELIDKIAAATGASKSNVQGILEETLGTFQETLAAGDSVVLQGFGKFEAKPTKARQGRNPKTGETLTIPAGRKVKFTPGKLLKEAVK